MAERNLSAGMLAALSAPVVRPALLYEGEFEGGQLRLFTGTGQIEWDGKTWFGGGEFLSITSIEETREMRAIGFTVGISGLKASNLSVALQSMRQGKPGRLWLACFDAAGALVADPYQLRRGRFDVAPIRRSGGDLTIEARYEDRRIDIEKPRERRYTHEDQQIDHAGDTGFRFVPNLQDAEFIWGHR